jgi:hypothetical protein
MLNFPQSLDQFLSDDECAQIDQTLLPTRDRFSIRIAVYSWRYVQRVSEGLGIAIADLTPAQISDWISQDAALQTSAATDESLTELLDRLVISSLGPLQKIAQQENTTIEQLTLPQIINWFEQQVKSALVGL